MDGKQYVTEVLDKVKKRNAGEKEFIDAITEVLNSLVPVFDKNPKFIEN